KLSRQYVAERGMPWRLLALVGLVLCSLLRVEPALAWEEWPSEWSSARPALPGNGIEPTSFIQASTFRLEVPFRTQKDGGLWQSSNCGPAALGMVLDAYGVAGQSTDDL